MEKDKFNNLEQEVQVLEKTLEEKKEKLKEMAPEEKEEMVREYTRKRLEKLTPKPKKTEIPPSRPTTIPSPPAKKVLPSYLDTQDEDTKKIVKDLVKLSEEKGLKTALNKIQKTNQPFLLDAFHDALTFKFLQELRKKDVI